MGGRRDLWACSRWGGFGCWPPDGWRVRRRDIVGLFEGVLTWGGRGGLDGGVSLISIIVQVMSSHHAAAAAIVLSSYLLLLEKHSKSHPLFRLPMQHFLASDFPELRKLHQSTSIRTTSPTPFSSHLYVSYSPLLMPCRVLPAAPSPSCLWITDDILSEAFNRFLRVSKAHLYHAKRFRSNAPGPLEARRRATKRRMGLTAVGSGGGGPPPFDMGALFGLGVKPGADMEEGMRWEGPQTPAPPLFDPESKVRGWLGPTHWKSVWQRQDDEERFAQFLHVPEDPVERSKTDFEALLAATPHGRKLDPIDLQPLLAYLQSPENEPKAHLTMQLLSYLHIRSAPEDCYSALVDIVKQKLALETITKHEVDKIVRELWRQVAANKHILEIATALPFQWTHTIFAEMTQQLAAASKDDSQVQRLDKWLAFLRGCSEIYGFRQHTGEGWKAVYAKLSWYFRPSDLAEHFCRIERKGAAMVILHHWVPKLARTSTGAPPALLDAKDKKRLRFMQTAVEEDDLPRLATHLMQTHDERIKGKHRRSPLLDLAQVLAEERIPYQTILEEIVSIYRQTESASTIRNMIKDIIRRPSVDMPTSLAADLVQCFMATDHLVYALQIFEEVPSLPFSEVYDLPLEMVRQGPGHGAIVFKILNRLVAGDTVPFRERRVRVQPLKQEHIDVVHLVAYAYAKSPHITARTAFRRVWECYRFLQDRQAPLDTLLSRAFVKAGISRPLSEEGKRPSATQTAFVLGIVQKLEGEEMARNLDELVFGLGKRVLKNKMSGLGSRARQAELRRDRADALMVRKTQGRLKRWKACGWYVKRLRTHGRARRKSRGHVSEEYPFAAPPRHMPAISKDVQWSSPVSDDIAEDVSRESSYAPFGSVSGPGIEAQPFDLHQYQVEPTAAYLPQSSPSEEVAIASPYVQESIDRRWQDIKAPADEETYHLRPLVRVELPDITAQTTEELELVDEDVVFLADRAISDEDIEAELTVVHTEQAAVVAGAETPQTLVTALPDSWSERPIAFPNTIGDGVQLAPLQACAFRSHDTLPEPLPSSNSTTAELDTEALEDAPLDHFDHQISNDAPPHTKTIATSPGDTSPHQGSAPQKTGMPLFPTSQDRASHQPYTRDVARKRYMEQERESQESNAVGWRRFANGLRNKRRGAGYDRWTKERRGKGSDRSPA